MNENEAIVAVVSTAILFASGLTVIKMWLTHRRETARPAVAPANDDRLQRIEQAVDAIAIEVERISEGQRFTSKLLSERGSVPIERPKGSV